MDKRKVFVALMVAILLLFAAGCNYLGGSSAQRIVRIGLYENAPKIYTAPNGQAVGLFAELIDAIAHEEDWQISYVPCQWAQCLEALVVRSINIDTY